LVSRSHRKLRVVTRIAVIGCGYVGLTTGACFAHLGHEVICADIDVEKIDALNRGDVPIVEDRLDGLVRDGLDDGNLQFVVGGEQAVRNCEIAFLCVPTPQEMDGSVDLSFIEVASATIAPVLPPGSIVVNKSTVPVGSTRVVERVLKRSDVIVVSNPEFLREGSAVQDFLHPDRIVIGVEDQSAAIKVASLYLGVPSPIIVTSPASAETIKYAANAFLATKLSYVNAIAAICEGVGADVNDVILGLGYDRRIGPEFLRPGPGWGGSCFPKDTRALVQIAKSAGYEFELLTGVIDVNEEQFARVIEKIRHAVGGELAGQKVAVWGLTFKAGTDDLRESPALRIVESLINEGALVHAYDPTVTEHHSVIPPAVVIGTDPKEVCREADVIVLLTEWDKFRWVSPGDVADLMVGRAVVDTRNILDRSDWIRHGFAYQGIGC
jgi:UDPglucose 6-dehydrogenase